MAWRQESNRWRGHAIRCALLCMMLLFSGVQVEVAGLGGIVSAAEPASLAYVPEDAVFIGTVRPADVLTKPEFAPLANVFREMGDIKKTLGVEFDEIERVTFVVRPKEYAPGRSSPQPLGMILETRKAATLTAMTKAMFSKATPQNVNGQTIFQNTSGPQNCYFPINDKSLVYSEDVASLELMLRAGKAGGAKAKWATEWKEVSTSVAGAIFHVEPLRESLKQEMQNAPPGIGLVIATFSPLYLNASTLKVVVGLDKQISISATAIGSNNDDGMKLKTTLDAAVTMAGGLLAQSKAEIERVPEAQKEMLTTIHESTTTLINSIKVTQSQSRATAVGLLPAKETGTLISLMVPAVTAARDAARRAQSANNMKQLALAMHNYHDTFGTFPAAVMLGPDETTTYSWRVALLPFLDQAQLYNEYNRNEPWDSEGNKKILERMPAVFRCPSEPADSTDSCYYALVGLDTIFVKEQGIGIADITDGTSNTIMFVETKRNIPWTKPEDISYDAEMDLPKLGGFFSGGYHVSLCDGSVRFFSELINQATLRAMITPDGGERVQ